MAIVSNYVITSINVTYMEFHNAYCVVLNCCSSYKILCACHIKLLIKITAVVKCQVIFNYLSIYIVAAYVYICVCVHTYILTCMRA